MTPLEMIAEWRKGCTNAGPVWVRCYPDAGPDEADRKSPAACAECTEALIGALEKVLREPNEGMQKAGAEEGGFHGYYGDDPENRQMAVRVWQVMAGAAQP